MTLELLEDGGWTRGGNKYTRLNSRNVSTRYVILFLNYDNARAFLKLNVTKSNYAIIFSSGLDASLQILDVRTLMKQQTYVASTPGSSLDLEWEHEGKSNYYIIFLNLIIHE